MPNTSKRRKGKQPEGGCACGAIRYELTAPPLIVHACHCRDCQRVTGSAFVVNVWIERKCVKTRGPAPTSFRLRGGSGKDHDVFFCPTCGTTLWSRYHVVRADCLFVRAGTLDDPSAITPDVHIYTRTKLPWVRLPEGTRAFEKIYQIDRVWSPESRARLQRAD
jgi:hypothetical protein